MQENAIETAPQTEQVLSIQSLPPLDAATLTIEQVRERLRVFDDPRFRFDAGPHEYWLGKRRLTSATSLVKKFSKPFNKNLQAPLTAAKTGQTVAQVLAEWERSGWVGSRLHEYIEWWYDGKVSEGYYHEDPEVALRSRKFREFQHERLGNYQAVGQEIRMFHVPPESVDDPSAGGLSGTLDFLGWHVPSQRLYVLDWKSSKKITTDKEGGYGNLFAPFEDVKKNEYNEYSLQISIYRIFLELIGIPTAGGAIVHLPANEEPACLYPAKDFRDRLRYLFGVA